MTLANADPNREAVERADALVRSAQESLIDDPTVFVKGAALGSLATLALARLAATKSRDPGIQEFAGGLRRNQDALRRELTTVAGRKRLDVTGALVYEDEE